MFLLLDIGTAFQGMASLLAGFLGGVLSFVFVVEGYLYMAAMDDVQKATHAKRAIGSAIAGGILIVVATQLAPQLVGIFGH